MNDIQLFKNERFGEVRVAGTSDEPLFCLADICRVLEIKNVSDCKSRLDQRGVVLTEGVSETTNQYGITTVQKVMLTFINEKNLYKVIMRSDKPQAEPFQDWVCGEVLPSIRKSGGYIATKEDDTPEMIMARAILVANETITRQKKQIEEAKKQISVLSPKAELMDRVMDTDQKIDIGQAAKILQLPFGRNTLFKKLKEKGVFFTNRNEPKQEYIKRGYFELKEKWIDRDNHDGFMVVKVLVTQKGLDFIAKIFDVVKYPKQMAMIL